MELKVKYQAVTSQPDEYYFQLYYVVADNSNSLPGACLVTKGSQIIDQGYPGALSRYSLDFVLLYAFLPALLLLGMITFKIRDKLVRH